MVSLEIYLEMTTFVNIKIPYVKLELSLERLIHYKQENI